jgi:ornithine cyclodeaminase
MPADFAVTELWQVLSGQASGRASAEEVTVFDSVGFALEDFSAMRYLEKYVLQRDALMLDLIPELINPKDLFGMGSTEAKHQSNSTDLRHNSQAKSVTA